MKNTVNINSIELINADCLQYLATLPDNTIDLIVTDPPYFKVKPNGWDNQWNGDADYLRWLDMCLAQFWRVLKPAGSLYLFSGHRLASDIEIMMRERFNVMNHIIWAKPSGRWNGCNKESLRSYFPATERILFAEHYQGPYKPNSDGYAEKSNEVKQHVMAPLITYFRDARAELGVTPRQIADATEKKNMASHWFGASQWQLTALREGEGVYRVTGSSGLNPEGWTVEIPQDINGNFLCFVDITTAEDGDLTVSVFRRRFDVETAMIIAGEPVAIS